MSRPQTARRRLVLAVSSLLCLVALSAEAGAFGASSPVRVPLKLAAGPGWLTRFNAWRASTGVAPVTENTTWSAGDYDHAVYMVKNNLITHYETVGTPYYTAAGDTAARNSNIYVSSSTSTTDEQAIDWWMQAPFHALGMMDPRLTATGFGSYRESKSGWDMGAAVDVLRGNPFTGGRYPVFFPGNGTSEPLTRYDGNESPNPLSACSGYTAPAGLPVFVQVGGNVATTAGPAHSFTGDGVALEHCVIDSNNASLGSSLKSRGAVILIPRQPLRGGVHYTVALTVNGVPYTWSFTVGPFFSLTAVSPTYGPPAGGTTVTITGSGFTNGLTAVNFGPTAATSFTVVDDGTVTAVAPAHAVGVVDVTVTTASGTSPVTTADRFAFATPCTSVTIAAVPPTPAYSGTQVTFTGAAVCPSANPSYQFWLRPAAQTNWQLAQAFSTSNQFHWNTSGVLGLVYVSVWARDANSPGIVASSLGSTDVFTSVGYTLNSAACVTASVSPTSASPQASGAPITFNAGSTGCPNPRYEFWMRPSTSTTWTMVQAYSAGASFAWNSGGKSGSFYFSAWAKDASSSTSSFDANATTLFTVNPVTCKLASIGASPASPQLAGTQVTFTASATCASPRYEFWMRPSTSSTWTMVQGYSTTATYAWNTTGLSGSYYFSGWVKDANSATGTFDTNATTLFAIGHLCTSAGITVTPASVAHGSGAHVIATATAGGCLNPRYEFWVRPASSSTWTMVQAYSTSNTYDWSSSGFGAGTVYISVWAKDAASPTGSFDANGTAGVSVT